MFVLSAGLFDDFASRVDIVVLALRIDFDGVASAIVDGVVVAFVSALICEAISLEAKAVEFAANLNTVVSRNFRRASGNVDC